MPVQVPQPSVSRPAGLSQWPSGCEEHFDAFVLRPPLARCGADPRLGGTAHLLVHLQTLQLKKNKCLSAPGVRSKYNSITKTIQSSTFIPVPLRGVLGAGASTGPWASTCPSGPAPDLVVTSARGWLCRSCCCWSCRMASSRRLLRLTVISSCSAVCWLMTCSTTSPSPEEKHKSNHEDCELFCL